MESRRPSYATPKKILFSNWMELKIFPFKILNWNLIFLFFSLFSQWKHPFFYYKGWGWLRLRMRMKVSCNDQHPVGPSQRWSSDSHLLSSLGFQHNSKINDFISDPSSASWIELSWIEWMNKYDLQKKTYEILLICFPLWTSESSCTVEDYYYYL